MKITKTWISIQLFALAITSVASAAPIPGTSSSEVAQDLKGYFRSELGFEIDARKTAWQPTQPPNKSPYVVAMYRSPGDQEGAQASLTVRVDDFKKRSYTLNSYVKKWLNEYPKFGFEVLGSQRFKQTGNTGFVIDLINRSSDRQLRQVVFVKNKHAVVITCRDDVETFVESLKGCNEIVRTFKW